MFGLSGLAAEVKENWGVGWGKSFMNSKYQTIFENKMHLEELGDILSHDN